MDTTDKMTRLVNKAAGYTATDTIIAFDGPTRPLIAGESVTFAGNSTVYDVKSSVVGSMTLSTQLGTTLADNVEITRQDRYAIIDIDNLADALGWENRVGNENDKTWLYKVALMARKKFELMTMPIAARTYTEVLSMSDRYDADTGARVYNKNLQLSHYPIVSVSSVTIDDTAVDPDDYEIQSELGILYASAGWPKGNFHISVTYIAGFETIPQDIVGYFIDYMQLTLAESHQGQKILIHAQSTGFTDPETSITYRDIDAIKRHIIDGMYHYRRLRVG